MRDERLDLVRRGVHPGRIDQPARQADRTGVHGRLDLADHRARAPRRRAAAGPRPRTDATDRPVADQEGEVRARARCSSTRSRYSPNVRQRATSSFGRSWSATSLPAGIGDRGERVAAVARQLGRVALVEVAGERAIHEDRAVGVAVRIDEPRRDDAARGRRSRSRRRRRRHRTGPRPPGCGRRAGRRRRAWRSRQCRQRAGRHAGPGRRPSMPRDDDMRTSRTPGRGLVIVRRPLW